MFVIKKLSLLFKHKKIELGLFFEVFFAICIFDKNQQFIYILGGFNGNINIKIKINNIELITNIPIQKQLSIGNVHFQVNDDLCGLHGMIGGKDKNLLSLTYYPNNIG
ncbi:hypothetical protein RFI_02042, partial [Reticulomyxa filosa]